MIGLPLPLTLCRWRDRVSRLTSDVSGLALVEFAMVLPFLLLLTTSGLELANYVIASKRMGEIAAMVADNASRMGDQNAINNKPIDESEINDVFIGADLQGGYLKIANNGRIILSSLQRNADGGQTIKWQRCYGAVQVDSAYGKEGKGATGTSFTGMGPTNNEVAAAAGTAVMVVEVTYKYKRLMPLIKLPLNDIKDVTAFNVRDSRDLGQPQNTSSVVKSTC